MGIITVQGVQKHFKTQIVLKNVSLEVAPGSIYALLGANGAGKSTLLKIITGLLTSDGGKVTIQDLNIQDQLLKAQRLFSFSGQAATVDDVLSGFENLVLIARLRYVPRPKQEAQHLLDQFKLSAAAKKRVADYSGGMRRRLDLAMSLIGNPEILFLDEPTTGLDPNSRDDLWVTIRDLRTQGKTIFLTTQYLEEADQLADQVGFLRDGKIVATGTPTEMKRLAGTDKLQLSFASTKQRDVAVQALRVFQPQAKETNLLQLELSETVATTLEVLRTLQEAHNQPTNFEVVTPTLDDVFKKLTQEDAK